MMKTISFGKFFLGNSNPFVLIAGPCQLESLDHTRGLCENILEVCKHTHVNLIFKGSYDKANRSSIKTQRGLGLQKGLEILRRIKEEFDIPVLTDVHEPWQCPIVAEAVDVLQIPAFLCRQTDLLTSAGETGKAINIKKGQFLAPWDMKHAAAKIEATGNQNILLCERGTTFGYNNLVNDFRSLPIMAQTGYPVIFDATHSVQQPGAIGLTSGGQREFVPVLARAACAVGISGLFIETHDDPDNAPSDGPNMVPIQSLGLLLDNLKRIDMVVKNC